MNMKSIFVISLFVLFFILNESYSQGNVEIENMRSELKRLWFFPVGQEVSIIEREINDVFQDRSHERLLSLDDNIFEIRFGNIIERYEQSFINFNNTKRKYVRWLFYIYLSYWWYYIDINDDARNRVKRYIELALKDFVFLKNLPEISYFPKEEIVSLKDIYNEVKTKVFRRIKINLKPDNIKDKGEIEILGERFNSIDEIHINKNIEYCKVAIDIPDSNYSKKNMNLYLDKLKNYDFFVRLFNPLSNLYLYLIIDISRSIKKEQLIDALNKMKKWIDPFNFKGRVLFLGENIIEEESYEVEAFLEEEMNDIIERYQRIRRENVEEGRLTNICSVFMDLQNEYFNTNEDADLFLILFTDGLHEENENIQVLYERNFERTLIEQQRKIKRCFINMQESFYGNWLTPFVFIIPCREELYADYNIYTVREKWYPIVIKWGGNVFPLGREIIFNAKVANSVKKMLRDICRYYPININQEEEEFVFKRVMLLINNKSPNSVDFSINFYDPDKGEDIEYYPFPIRGERVGSNFGKLQNGFFEFSISSRSEIICNFFLKTSKSLNDVRFEYLLNNFKFTRDKKFKSITNIFYNEINRENKIIIQPLSEGLEEIGIRVEIPEDARIKHKASMKEKISKEKYGEEIKFIVPIKGTKIGKIKNEPRDVSFFIKENKFKIRTYLEKIIVFDSKARMLVYLRAVSLSILFTYSIVFLVLLILFVKKEEDEENKKKATGKIKPKLFKFLLNRKMVLIISLFWLSFIPFIRFNDMPFKKEAFNILIFVTWTFWLIDITWIILINKKIRNYLKSRLEPFIYPILILLIGNFIFYRWNRLTVHLDMGTLGFPLLIINTTLIISQLLKGKNRE